MSEPSILQCPNCKTLLPEARSQLPWCECGWNAPIDPVENLKGLQKILGKLSRWFGQVQARMDERWLRRKNPERDILWILLTGSILSLGVIFEILTIAFFGILIAIFVFAILIFQQNCIIAILLMAASGVLLYSLGIRRIVKADSRKTISLEQERVLETACDVAKRLNLSSPDAISFSPWPIIRSYSFFSWAPFPRIRRSILIGVPLLTTLTVTELKILIGCELYFIDGMRAWFLPRIQKALHWLWNAFSEFPAMFIEATVDRLVVLFTFLLVFSFFTWNLGSFLRPIGSVLFFLMIALTFVSLILGIVLFLLVFWFRRQTILADRCVTTSYGRNALLQAYKKLWLTQYVFDVRRDGMGSEARWNPETANLYTQFRKAWNGTSDPYKEKALREISNGFRSFLYFDPILADRAKLFEGLPDHLLDNRPADTLLPGITELGAMMVSKL